MASLGYQGDQPSVADISAICDTYGWQYGWRTADTEETTVHHAVATWPGMIWKPFVFILDTRTMTIVLSEHDSYAELDILEAVSELNEQW